MGSRPARYGAAIAATVKTTRIRNPAHAPLCRKNRPRAVDGRSRGETLASADAREPIIGSRRGTRPGERGDPAGRS